ncbi:hypothetical protein ABFV99_14200 [Cytobacillus horneckiae]|uniref:hypothetical protein n=1 Tax=Cytobacillus horneckiae TaxID=549687 RepID=UPI0034CECACC
MKQLKVILSPHFNEEEFFEEVSGITFEKGRGITTYNISLEDNKLKGIQSALRKNILMPFDKVTNEFVNGKNIVEDEPTEPEAEPAMVAMAVEQAPKTTRKRKKPKATDEEEAE